MNRRSVLQALGVGGAASLAGCGESSSNETNGDPMEQTERTEQTDEGPNVDGLSEDQIQETYLADSLLEYGVTGWARKEGVRVYDSQADDLAVVEPENGWFLEVNLTLYNAGGEGLEPPSDDAFGLYLDGQEHEQINGLPSDQFTFSDMREHFDVSLSPEAQFLPSTLDPDSFAQAVLLFDVETQPVDWAINITEALREETDQDQYIYYSE